jgi:hypothetical protein
MSDSDANFLSRWSRLKQRSRAAGPVSDDGTAAPVTGEELAARVPATAGAAAVPGAAAAANAPAPPGGEQPDPAVPVRIDEPLPPLESLTADSDFRPFMRAGIDAATRNAALKRLFADPAFNVMDGLDVYIDDYGKTEPIPSALLRRLVQAQSPVLADAAADPTHDLAHDLAHDSTLDLTQIAGGAAAQAAAAGQPERVGDDSSADAPCGDAGVAGGAGEPADEADRRTAVAAPADPNRAPQ